MSRRNRCFILLEKHAKTVKPGKFSTACPITEKHRIEKCQKQPIFIRYKSNLQLLKII